MTHFPKPGPFAEFIEAEAAKVRHATAVHNVHLGVRDMLRVELARADHTHEVTDADPSDWRSVLAFVGATLAHAHETAAAALAGRGPRLITLVAPWWVNTALPPGHGIADPRGGTYRYVQRPGADGPRPFVEHTTAPGGERIEYVPLWEDLCADVWHLVALAGVDRDGRGVSPSIMLGNYEWIGAYPAPTIHAGMASHEPCDRDQHTNHRTGDITGA